jgi:hypothetical protein
LGNIKFSKFRSIQSMLRDLNLISLSDFNACHISRQSVSFTS